MSFMSSIDVLVHNHVIKFQERKNGFIVKGNEQSHVSIGKLSKLYNVRRNCSILTYVLRVEKHATSTCQKMAASIESLFVHLLW